MRNEDEGYERTEINEWNCCSPATSKERQRNKDPGTNKESRSRVRRRDKLPFLSRQRRHCSLEASVTLGMTDRRAAS